MNLVITPLELRFPDAETALAVARTLSGNAALEVLPPDGSLAGIRYDIAVVNGTGIVHPPLAESAGSAPAPEPLPGYHVIGLWRGAPETIPASLTPYLIPAGPIGVAFG